MLEAVFQTHRDRRWIKFIPEFRLLPSLRQVAAEELSEAGNRLPALASPEGREQFRLVTERRRDRSQRTECWRDLAKLFQG